MSQRRPDEQGDTKTRTKVTKPRLYKVLIHNDDYTSMEFVVFVLQSVFSHSMAGATRIMLHVHKNGIGVAGVYTKGIAETRVIKTIDLARESGHPLQCTMEPE